MSQLLAGLPVAKSAVISETWCVILQY